MLQLPNNLRQIFKINLLFISLASAIIFIMGFALVGLAHDVKIITKYLENAATIQPNYEKNIILYTSKTEKIINSLLRIRPSTQEDFVGFISEVETLGQSLNLNLDVKALGGVQKAPKGKAGDGGKQVSYNVSFYGSNNNLLQLLEAFEGMPYYIDISSVSYDNVDSLSPDQKETFNIRIKINLFVK